jgi:hypothetical protein
VARARARVQRSESIESESWSESESESSKEYGSESGCSKERERVFERERMFKCSKVRGVLSTEILSRIEFLSIWHDFECMVVQSETKLAESARYYT